MKKILFLIISFWVLFCPLVSLAGEYKADGKTVTYDGLVPCGKVVKVDGEEVYMPCQFCHFFVMAKGIVDFLLLPPTGIVFLVGVLMLVIAGAMFIFGYLVSPENPELISNAKSLMTSVIIGLIIIFGAWVFVNTFFLLIGVADWTGLKGGWFQINCPIELPGS